MPISLVSFNLLIGILVNNQITHIATLVLLRYSLRAQSLHGCQLKAKSLDRYNFFCLSSQSAQADFVLLAAIL